MLVIEQNRNGQRVVVIKKDWHVGRISRAYIPPVRNNVESQDAYRLQSALLRRRK